jgi:hypothetical protein
MATPVDQLEALVFDEGRVVPYTWLARSLSITAQAAKE